MDTSIIRAGKEGGMCRVPSRKIPQQASASLVAMGSFLLLRPWSIHGKTTNMSVSLSFRAMLPQKPGSAAIVWPRTYLSKHVPSYLSRAAPQLVSQRERTNLPPFPPICCRDLLVGGWPPTIFDTHGNCMVGRRFGGPAGAPCSPGPERLDAHPSHRALPAMVPRHRTERCIVSA